LDRLVFKGTRETRETKGIKVMKVCRARKAIKVYKAWLGSEPKVRKAVAVQRVQMETKGLKGSKEPSEE
jgi:hypothetical protein